jgi:hypothetical protein
VKAALAFVACLLLAPSAAAALNVTLGGASASSADRLHVHGPGLPRIDHDHGLPLQPRTGHATPPQWQSADAPGDYRVQFRCASALNSTYAALGCPLYVLDPEDIMGQPVLMVDPRDPNFVAFHALHGGSGLHLVGPQPPSNRSRDDYLHQPHTVFQTIDGGGQWSDNRYYSIWRTEVGGEYDSVFGEDNAAVLDAAGNMNIGSLYAFKNQEESAFRYAAIIWKSNPINMPFERDNRYKVFRANATGAAMDSLHMAYVPGSDAVVALWREFGGSTALPLGAEGARSYIRVAYSAAGEGAPWQELPGANAVGPCQAITNPVVIQSLIFIGCLPGAGAAPDIDGRFWHVYLIDIAQQRSAHVAQVAIPGGQAVLASRGGDRLVLAAAGMNGNNPWVRLAFGSTDNRFWERLEPNYATSLRNLQVMQEPGTRVVQARILALAQSPLSHYLHVIYQERYERQASPSNVGLPDFYKSFGALDPNGAFMGRFDLNIGDAQTRVHFEPQYQGVGEAVFDELKDSIVILTDRRGNPREFVAYGDYGYVRFAEIAEENFALIVPPLGGGPPAFPAANPGVDPATVGTVAGALAGAMTLRLLAARKKRKVEAPSL